MNVLTKLFVVALVVLSLLETAAFVVFAQRVQYTQTANKKLTTEAEDARTQRNAAIAEADGIRSTISRQQGELATRATASRKTEADLLQRIADKENQLAEANKQIGTLQLDMANLTNQGGLLATILDAKDKQLNVVRIEADDKNKKYLETASALQDVQQRAEVLKREWQAAQEERARLEAENADLRKGGVAMSVPVPGAPASAARINGRVTKVTKDTNGQLLATINVGQADGVAKGTRLTVYDNERGLFLGFLTVQAVDSNTAMGPIEGPRVAEIAEGSSVQNQM